MDKARLPWAMLLLDERVFEGYEDFSSTVSYHLRVVGISTIAPSTLRSTSLARTKKKSVIVW